MPSVRVPNLLPSTAGLHFPNAFPSEPAVQVPLPDGRSLALGNAANGLCGGMVFTVRDYFEAGRPTPPDTSPPAEGSPLFEYLVGRLLASFNLPLGIGRYLELMNPLLPDAAPADLPVANRARVMLQQEWPRIQQELDSGHPAALGLILIKSSNAEDLGKNHQVLAYGYDLDGASLTLAIYDPNAPDRDDIQLTLSLADPSSPVALNYSVGESVFCFFHTPYSPPDVAPP